jgi:hypothetical protein
LRGVPSREGILDRLRAHLRRDPVRLAGMLCEIYDKALPVGRIAALLDDFERPQDEAGDGLAFRPVLSAAE